jgi:predicted nucleotidyltransferase
VAKPDNLLLITFDSMRLTKEQIAAIKNQVHQFDKDAVVRLFGSRVHDELRGGDIDLLILSSKITYRDKLLLRSLLKDHLGNRKIDILVKDKPDSAFTKEAFRNSITL